MRTRLVCRFLLSAKPAAVIALAFALSGCLPSTGTPERLYPVASEMDVVRTTQEELVRQYNFYVFSAPAQARLIRNEIISQRMYAVDVQYTQYENALTREGQEINFGTLATAGALGTASTLFTPVVTKSVLSGLSTVALATDGHYNSEILLAQSMRTIQKQMRASRNLIASDISAKLVKSVFDYPLSAALSDVEEYYNAGTLTTGVIDASTTVGIKEADTKGLKQDVTQAPPAARAGIIREAAMRTGSSLTGDGLGSGRSDSGGKVTGTKDGANKSGQGNQGNNTAACSTKTTSGPDDNTKIINDWFRPNLVVNSDNQKRLKEFVASIDRCILVSQFLTAQEQADNRAKFVQALRKEKLIP
jgi:hypothetical protein